MTRSSAWHQQQAQLERAWLDTWIRGNRHEPAAKYHPVIIRPQDRDETPAIITR
ncbi:hypothetical protein [Streptomyces zhihengii]